MAEKFKVPVEKGKTYTIDILRLGSNGEGVGRVENFTVFVDGALPGETVTARITFVKKQYATGRLEKVQNPSEHRVKPPCSVYAECGGCQLQHLSYEGQLAEKRQQVQDAVERIGKLKDIPILPTLGADEPWAYRNKMQLPVGAIKKAFTSAVLPKNRIVLSTLMPVPFKKGAITKLFPSFGSG